MPASNNLNVLVGATTRYIAGRNAMQTSYWRTAGDGKLIKYNKTCEFARGQQTPANVRHRFINRNYALTRKF